MVLSISQQDLSPLCTDHLPKCRYHRNKKNQCLVSEIDLDVEHNFKFWTVKQQPDVKIYICKIDLAIERIFYEILGIRLQK